MRARFSGLLVAWLLGACVPSQRSAFEPVRQGVQARLGQQVRWGDEEDARLAGEEVRRRLSKALHLEDAVQIALLHDRALRARFAELGVARARLLEATLPPNPVVQGEVLAPVGEGEARGGLSAQLDFLGVLLLPEQQALATSELEAARLELLGLALEVAFDVSTRFHTYQAARARLELLEDVVGLAERGVRAAERLWREGELTRLELLELEAEATAARLALLAARTDAALARARLGAALGLADDGDWEIAAGLPAPSALAPEKIVDTALERSVALELARRRVEVAARALGIVDATRLLPALGPGVAGEVEDGALFVGPQVQLELPLFDQGQGRVEERAAELRGYQEAYRARLVQLVTTARVTEQQLALAEERLAFLDARALPVRESVLDEVTRLHRQGRVGDLELLAARRALLEMRLDRVEALLAYWLARDAWELLASGGLPDVTGSVALDR